MAQVKSKKNKPANRTFFDALLLPGPWKNFAGNEDQYNPAGKRYFTLGLEDDQQFQDMDDEGWPVKYTKPSKSDPEPELFIPTPILKVHVSFLYEVTSPDIFLITSRATTKLTEDMVGMLDKMRFKMVDIIINSSFWEMPNGDTGYKAWLSTGYFTVDENELEMKYGVDPGLEADGD